MIAPMPRSHTLLLLIAGIAFLVPGCGGDDDKSTTAATTGAAATTEPAAAPKTTSMARAGAKRIRIHGDWLAAGEGGVWLSGEKEIHRLEPRTGHRVATIRVPDGPCEASDVGYGSVWTATCDKPGLARIDPATNRVADRVALKIPDALEGEGSIGAGEGGVWLVVDGEGCTGCRLVKVDPRSLQVTARIDVERGSAGVRVGEGSVWVTNPERGVVQQVDPDRERVVRTSPSGRAPRFLAVGERGVWALDQSDGTVIRLDPVTGKRTANVQTDHAGEGGDMSTGAGWVWARGPFYLLSRIDPQTNRVVENYEPQSGSGAVIVGFGAVCISAHDVDAVWRLPVPRG